MAFSLNFFYLAVILKQPHKILPHQFSFPFPWNPKLSFKHQKKSRHPGIPQRNTDIFSSRVAPPFTLEITRISIVSPEGADVTTAPG